MASPRAQPAHPLQSGPGSGPAVAPSFWGASWFCGPWTHRRPFPLMSAGGTGKDPNHEPATALRLHHSEKHRWQNSTWPHFIHSTFRFAEPSPCAKHLCCQALKEQNTRIKQEHPSTCPWYSQWGRHHDQSENNQIWQ